MSRASRTVVAIVDDDASVRRGLGRLLGSHDITAVPFQSGRDLIGHANLDEFHCIILDLHMPEMDGLSVQEHLASRPDAPPLVFLTGHGTISTSVQAIKAGATDFLVKPVDENKLLAAITAARKHGTAERAELACLRLGRERMAAVTPREFEVLQCVLSGARNRAIGVHLGITEKTVKVHRASIMAKLDAHTVADLAMLCAKLGVQAS